MKKQFIAGLITSMVVTALLFTWSCKKEDVEDGAKKQHKSLINPSSDKIQDFLDTEQFSDFCEIADFTPDLDNVDKDEENGFDVYQIPADNSSGSDIRVLTVVSRSNSNVYQPVFYTHSVVDDYHSISAKPISGNSDYFNFSGQEEEDEPAVPCNQSTSNFGDCLECAYAELYSDWVSIVTCTAFPWACLAGASIACALIIENPDGGNDPSIISDLEEHYSSVTYNSANDVIIVN